jgi:hypothetical protein
MSDAAGFSINENRNRLVHRTFFAITPFPQALLSRTYEPPPACAPTSKRAPFLAPSQGRRNAVGPQTRAFSGALPCIEMRNNQEQHCLIHPPNNTNTNPSQQSSTKLCHRLMAPRRLTVVIVNSFPSKSGVFCCGPASMATAAFILTLIANSRCNLVKVSNDEIT